MDRYDYAVEFMNCDDMEERRVTPKIQLPYITEEGLVLIDRRENGERRATQRQPVSAGVIMQYADQPKLTA